MESFMREEVYLMRPVDIVIGEPLGAGYGNIDAGEQTPEELEFLGAKIEEHLVSVSPNAPMCCIDGRCGMHTLAGRGTEPRPSLAGGPVSVYAAAELTGLLGDTEGTPLERLERVIGFLEAAGIPVGNHIDQGAEATINEDGLLTGNKTGCGANDRFLENIGHIDTDRGTVLDVTKALLEGDYNLSRTNFTSITALKSRLADWDPVANTNMMAAKDADSIEVLESDNTPTHGHHELLAVPIYEENVTLDRDAFVKDTGKQVFVIDMWYLKKIANALAVGPEAEEMGERLYHALVAYQVGTYLTLCNGTQRTATVKPQAFITA